jgi:flagellar biosynthetic protein FliR
MLELLGFSLGQFEVFILIAMRTTSMISVMAIFSNSSMAPKLRIFLGFALALMCTAIVPQPDILPVTFLMLIPLTIKEVLTGLALGYIGNFLFEALKFSGFLSARLMGLSMMTIVDPSSSEKNNVLSQLLVFFAIFLLFVTDGHLFFFKAIIDSFYILPLFKLGFHNNIILELVRMIQNIFVIGIKISAPILVILYMVRIVLGIMAKLNPDMNVFFVSLPLSIIVGLYVMAFTWPFFAYIFNKVFQVFKTDYLTITKLLALFSPL